VPLVLESIRTFDLDILPFLFPPRATTSEVYAQIIADLETALATAPVSAINKIMLLKGS